MQQSHTDARRRSNRASIPRFFERPETASAAQPRLRERHSNYSNTPPANTEAAYRNECLMTMSSMSSIRHEHEHAGIFDSQSSTPSAAVDSTFAANTPTFEYYGFVVYLVSLAAFVVYLLWAYLPDQALEAAGITYYPDRYWAVALPAWWLMAVAFIYLFNIAMNMYNTPLLNSKDNITDPFSNLHNIIDNPQTFCYEEIGGIPPIGDIPISLVNQCLYQ
ncbi:PIG-P-domain-containing protein [Coemansia reversa NRRL 1564]|uniref:PIG-P-domain-containing protein n=1 Tax=Coemansia reversa (strain ATCC 12441 / NRRL 1564) TaxID=763665 RepID=A0A2G5BEB5_COERN|nr:PIG-P-domain-containing protein [Coemansia reversa NRRL 1564]|eukprot:PIA17343.1 PIG-P-domain-containing protein [Coemansia reversa NRRL 1564]